jgi:hypothetical protein
MTNESLDDLKAAFKGWRLKKRYSTERVPAELLARVQRAVGEHGITCVIKATKVRRYHLAEHGPRGSSRGKKAVIPVPMFSRVQVMAPAAASAPVAEAETSGGMKLRVFSITPETMGLMSSFCRAGGAT